MMMMMKMEEEVEGVNISKREDKERQLIFLA